MLKPNGLALILRGWRQASLALVLAAGCCCSAGAVDLGIEGSIYEPLEEDFRIAMMRLLAREDQSRFGRDLQESAENYTKSLPSYYLPLAEKTLTRWKDAGAILIEDVFLPMVKDWENGSVYETEPVQIAKAGDYFNPIMMLPASGIERLFIFDSTDPQQWALAQTLIAKNISQLSFMTVSGDVGELSKTLKKPIYHPAPTQLEKFNIRALPTLIGFGQGVHQGHIALTEFKIPADVEIVLQAWYGLDSTSKGQALGVPSPALSPESVPVSSQ